MYICRKNKRLSLFSKVNRDITPKKTSMTVCFTEKSQALSPPNCPVHSKYPTSVGLIPNDKHVSSAFVSEFEDMKKQVRLNIQKEMHDSKIQEVELMISEQTM
jgi:hypothetical protein